MSSLIGSFRNASEALHQDQLALNATADNISNQNTAGYARREVVFNARDTVTLSSNYTSNGTGVRTPQVSITAQRDANLDRSVADTTSSSGSASTAKSALNTLQSVFAIDSSGQESSGISTAISGFFSALRSVAADTSNSSARQAAFTAGQAVVSSFQNTSSQLSQQTDALNATITGVVSNVNEKAAAIAELNGRIARASSTEDRQVLVDERTALIQGLSSLAGLQPTISSDGSVSLFTSSGAALVVGSSSNSLSTSTVNGSLRVFSQGSDVTQGLSGGSLGGALAVRDGTLATPQSTLDLLATSFATAVNAVNANGKTSTGGIGQALFSLPLPPAHAAAGITLQATSGNDYAAASSTEGNGGNGNANSLIALESAKNTGGLSFSDVLSNLVGNIGTVASASQDTATRASSALAQATANRDAFSGISLDAEAANLTQYQRSYQAEAKLLSVLNDIMASAINLGTNTAVS